MARRVRDTTLDTRSARLRLKARHEPYWRAIDRGMSLGYRKGKWIARYFTRKGSYLKKRLGIADDVQDADGLAVLDFAQAQERARSWFQAQIRIERGLTATGKYTVANALDDYIKELEAGGGRYGGKSVPDLKRRIEMWILPRLGETIVTDLTSQEVRAWHRKLASERPRLRSKKLGNGAGKVRHRDTSDDPEASRKRRHSANRVLTILKAALNHAFAERKVLTDEAWRSVKPFKGVDAPRIQYLARDECVRLINACAEDFRKMVRAALYTGCRYGELVRLQVRDFDRDAGTVFVRVSKSGKPRQVILADEGRRFFENETTGRLGDETIFLRADGQPWGPSHQQRPLSQACDHAKIVPRASFHILRHTYASDLVMNGVPLGVVAANLGHSDTRITERHYAHLAPSYIADAIRAGSRGLGIVDDTNIAPIRSTR